MTFLFMKSVRKYIVSQLAAEYEGDEAEALAWWILEEVTGKSRSELLVLTTGLLPADNDLLADNDLSIDYKERIDSIISRLLRHEPIQYIFGHTEWGGLDLKVTPDVLIPRPETAELIRKLEDLKIVSQSSPSADGQMFKSFKILDIGTGSGCLAIALKKRFPQAEVIGIDISEAALEVARENAKRNNVEVRFYQADALEFGIRNLELGINSSHGFDGLKTEFNFSKPSTSDSQLLSTFNFQLSTFDVIVSNPPYIMESEKCQMDVNVLDFEPHSALFVPDNDPLLFYRAIARYASSHLEPDGLMILEINQQLGAETKELFRSIMPDAKVELLKDDYNNDRFVIVS